MSRSHPSNFSQNKDLFLTKDFSFSLKPLLNIGFGSCWCGRPCRLEPARQPADPAAEPGKSSIHVRHFQPKKITSNQVSAVSPAYPGGHSVAIRPKQRLAEAVRHAGPDGPSRCRGCGSAYLFVYAVGLGLFTNLSPCQLTPVSIDNHQRTHTAPSLKPLPRTCLSQLPNTQTQPTQH